MTFKEYAKGLGDNDGFEFTNLNPSNLCTGDCSTRAIAGALGVTYDQAIDLQANKAKSTHYGLTDNEVVISIIEEHGFVGHKIGASKKGCRRVKVGELAKENANKICVIRCACHFTLAKGGKILDTWNCSNKAAYGIWTKET